MLLKKEKNGKRNFRGIAKKCTLIKKNKRSTKNKIELF